MTAAALATPEVAPTSNTRLCRQCRSRLVYAKTAAGKLVAVDGRATKAGPLVLESVALEVPTAVTFDQVRHGADYPLRYTDHATTCEYRGRR